MIKIILLLICQLHHFVVVVKTNMSCSNLLIYLILLLSTILLSKICLFCFQYLIDAFLNEDYLPKAFDCLCLIHELF